MNKWEYDKIDLNALPPKTTDLDLLNDAGNDGWELVALTTNNTAVLKRQLVTKPPSRSATKGPAT